MVQRIAAAAVDVAIVAVAVLVALTLAPPRDVPRPVTTARPDGAELHAAIDRLPVAEPGAVAPYDRAQFPHWIDVAPGCDTRCAVLDRQRDPAGWLSAYDGYVATEARELEIDHVVPLAEAWVSGASTWTLGRRQAFANDLAGGELLAVSAWSNRDKGASDPAAWRPPDPSWWCIYGDAWVDVKLRWALTADDAEVAALHEMAERC